MGAIIIACSALALWRPGLFAWVAPHVAPLLGVIMFGMGMTLRWEDFSHVFLRPRDIVLGLAAQFGCMPLLAFLLCRLFRLPPDLAMGVILVGAAPGVTASNVLTFIARGDVPYSVALTAVATFLSLGLMPLLTWLLGGVWVPVDVWGLFLSIVNIVLLPVLLGLTAHRFCRPLTQKALPFLPLLSSLVITLVVAGIIAVNAERILHAEASVFLVVIVHGAGPDAFFTDLGHCRSPVQRLAEHFRGAAFQLFSHPPARRGNNKGAGMNSRFLPILGGTMIVAGTAIGAGMLALPMISAGMWFYWSVGLLLVSWFCMFRSSQAILEVNLHFEPGDSFHTLVRELLGPFWSTLNGLAVAFVLYTLVYAYVSGGGSVVQQSLAPILGSTPPRLLSSLLFALLLTVCVWWSSKMVDRLSVLLMGGMALSFLLSISGMIGHIRLDTLQTPRAAAAGPSSSGELCPPI